MIPALATAYINHPELLRRFMHSTTTHPVGHSIVVNNSNGPFSTTMAEVIGLGVNVGFAGAVNMICDRVFNQLQLPWVLIAGNDIEFLPGDLKIFEDTVKNFEVADFVFGNHSYGNFVIKRSGWEKVGAMDENLWPAYTEDGDHWRRIQLTGAKAIHCAGLRCNHEGSSAIKGDEAFSRWVKDRQRINWGIFSRKWGCPEWSTGAETFTTPYNEGGPVNAWKLSDSRMKEPHYFTQWP